MSIKPTQQDIEKLRNNPDFVEFTKAIGGVYVAISIAEDWMDEASDHLKKLIDINRHDFKFGFNQMMKHVNAFEVRLRKYCINKEDFLENYPRYQNAFNELIEKQRIGYDETN
jgi:hypothetical protein